MDFLEIDGEFLVSNNNETIVMNKTAFEIFNLYKQGMNDTEVIEQMKNSYSVVNKDVIYEDCLEILKTIKNLKNDWRVKN